MRWVIGYALRLGARWVSAAVLGIVVAWAAGRVLNDRWPASQYLWWLPGKLIVLGGGAGVLVAWAMGAIGARIAGRRPRRPMVWAAAGAVVMCAMWAAVVEWRVQRFVVGVSSVARAEPVEAGALRVVFWNAWSMERAAEADPSIAQGADLVVVSNARSPDAWRGLAEAMGPGHAVMRWGRFTVLSRSPLGAAAWTQLGLHGRRPWVAETDSRGVDDGEAMWVTIDARSTLGREIVVWLVDLPSDPTRWRGEMMRSARGAITSWRGVSAPGAPVGFPAPDLLLGDLNTPEGSWSLSLLAPGMRSAWAEAGRGDPATWPRPLPLWRLDHALLADHLACVRACVVNPGAGFHRAIRVDIVASGRGG